MWYLVLGAYVFVYRPSITLRSKVNYFVAQKIVDWFCIRRHWSRLNLVCYLFGWELRWEYLDDSIEHTKAFMFWPVCMRAILLRHSGRIYEVHYGAY